MMWNLERPTAPALPHSYFWTWDHCCNWVLDDPGLVNFGCYNAYLKSTATFIEDYRRLTDLAAGLGVKGVIIWGFLRDSHGGIEAARRVADYAASRGVAIMPGVGTSWYGGCYYEGDHPYNMDTFLRANPDAVLLNPEYDEYGRGVCPTHPQFVAWLREGLEWLYDTFPIGGVNLENGDYVVCLEERCKAHHAAWPADDPDVFHMQYLGYEPALRVLEPRLERELITYATYTGFTPGTPPPEEKGNWAWMRCERPAMFDRMPSGGLCQWTLTAMVRKQPLPLTAWLDDGAPDAAFDNPAWPCGVVSCAPRAVGFLHQGNQCTGNRYDCVISTIKEGCLRGYRSGLEGISVHGEVTSRHIPWALNYLAFSHFIHWPEATLRDFGRRTLGQVLADEAEGEAFIEIFAHHDAGTLSDAQRADARARAERLSAAVCKGHDHQRWLFWSWLDRLVHGVVERYTQSQF